MALLFGHVDRVGEGDVFADRIELSNKNVHPPTQAGISGNQDIGAVSIVLSGGYEDDEDHGDEIIYTGQGGRKKNQTRQTFDQELTRGNRALARNIDTGEPVRVIRGSTHKSKYSPKSGYRYDGLYRVVQCWPEKGKSGFIVYRYRLIKYIAGVDSSEPTQGDAEKKFVTSTITRLVRDTELSKSVKKKYKYKCQICGESIPTKTGFYAEGAHIRPIGKPHNGDDKLDNIICLCPSHHVMLDVGAITIGADLNIVGIGRKLTLKGNHKLNQDNLTYHSRHIHGNEPLEQ